MNALRLAWLDLSRRPLSSVIAVVSIGLSVATAGTLLRLVHLADQRFSTLAIGADAIVGAKSGDLDILLGALNSELAPTNPPGYLPMKLFESLRANAPVKFEDGHEAQPGFIKSVTPFVYAGTLDGAPAVGIDDSWLLNQSHSEFGLFRLAQGRWANAPAELVIGSTLARERGYQLNSVVQVQPLKPAAPGAGPEPSASLIGQPLPFQIVGILNSTSSAWDRHAWMTLPSARVLLSHTRLRNSIWGNDVLNYFLIRLPEESVTESLVKLKALVNDRTVGQVVDVPEAKAKLRELTGSGRDVGLLVVALVLVMAVLSLASVLITRFESLSLQLAVLRAIGYSKRELAIWLLCEGLMIGLTACVVGAFIDAVLFPVIRSRLGSSLPGPEIVSSSVFESSPVWLAAVIATLLAVVIPIVRAYRQDVNTSLRA